MTEDKPVYGYIFRGVHVRLLHRVIVQGFRGVCGYSVPVTQRPCTHHYL